MQIFAELTSGNKLMDIVDASAAGWTIVRWCKAKHWRTLWWRRGQNLEPLNHLGILLKPILHLILNMLTQTKLNLLQAISALMVVSLSIRCLFVKTSHAASRTPVHVHYVQWVLTHAKKTPPNLRNTRLFFHCIYNMFL